MKAVITVVGRDSVGILSNVSAQCAKYNVNICDVTQSILDGMFCMMMICDISAINQPFVQFAEDTKEMGKKIGMQIHVMHSDIFDSMHRI